MNCILLAEQIREFRHRNGLTQAEFGNLIGVSPQAVSKWEREESYPDITLLPELSALLQCSINDFFNTDFPSK